MTTLFGIKNCDTVKKARKWLDQQNLEYQFHDVRSDGLTESKVKEWLDSVDWQLLINKRSTTWKQLSDDVKQSLNEANVIPVVLENPTLIKRPVLEFDNAVFIGFKPAEYENIFSVS